MKKTIFTTAFFISSLIMAISCKKEVKQPTKSQCEISNTGTIKMVNKTSYAVTVSIDGGTPSNMGYLSPGAEASIDVTAGSNHSIAVHTVAGSSSTYSWTMQNSVGACATSAINIIL